MARNTSVSLGDHFTEFIDSLVASGRYATASDVIRAGLRLLEAEEARRSALIQELEQGMDDIRAGRVQEVTDQYWDDLDQRLEKRRSTTRTKALRKSA